MPKVQFLTGSAAGDCCTPRLPWKGLDVVTFLDRAETTKIDGVVVRYLAIGDLIAMRRATQRPKDLRCAAELERLARRTPYMSNSATRHFLRDHSGLSLGECWAVAIVYA